MTGRAARGGNALWIGLGLLLALSLWAAAAVQLCGISGCGGGGFGRSYSPGWVQLLLLVSGAAAAAGALRAARAQRSPQLLAAAAVLLVAFPMVGGLVIGARPNGYPRSVPMDVVELEEERVRERERERSG